MECVAGAARERRIDGRDLIHFDQECWSELGVSAALDRARLMARLQEASKEAAAAEQAAAPRAAVEVLPAASTLVVSVRKRKLRPASAGGAAVEVQPAASTSVGSVKKRKLKSAKRQVCDELNQLRRDQRQYSAKQRQQRRVLKVQLRGLKHSHGNDNHGKG